MTMAKHWYAIHTYSGHENKARLSLQERIRTSGQGTEETESE